MHDSVTVHMAAPPERVWDLVSDVTRIGSYSPETFEAEWIEGATGPAVGARFRGHVKRNGIGPIYWTTCTVSECEPGKTFAFGVGAAGKRPLNVWRYDIAPADGGSDVTESFTLSPTFGLRLYWAAVGVVPGQGQSQGHAHDARADPGRGGSRAGGVGVEDRPSTAAPPGARRRLAGGVRRRGRGDAGAAQGVGAGDLVGELRLRAHRPAHAHPRRPDAPRRRGRRGLRGPVSPQPRSRSPTPSAGTPAPARAS